MRPLISPVFHCTDWTCGGITAVRGHLVLALLFLIRLAAPDEHRETFHYELQRAALQRYELTAAKAAGEG
jgi:hypothetical protein